MTRTPARSDSAPPRRPFAPVRTRVRHDGWTAARQIAFIEALAECACVDEACRHVGISASAAYALRRRPDAASFRQAWDHALDYAIGRLADAALSRALHGVAQPVFYKGEQVGERRQFDERLTMFLLRLRDPVRFAAWIDRRDAVRHPEGAPLTLARSLLRVERDALAAEAGEAMPPLPSIETVRLVTAEDHQAEQDARREAEADAAQRARWAAEDAWLWQSGGDDGDAGGSRRTPGGYGS